MKRLPRKKKKATRQCALLHGGNPSVIKTRLPKLRWYTVYRGYKDWVNTISRNERREANKVKIKNL